MKEVVVHPGPPLTTEIHEVPIPIPQDDEIVIKVAVAGSNVKGGSTLFADLCRTNDTAQQTGSTLQR